MKQTMKRALSLALALAMSAALLLPTAWADSGDDITVTVRFDASTVAYNLNQLYGDLQAAYIVDKNTTNLPDEIEVTVEKGSTVQQVLQAAKEKQDFTVEGLEKGYITQVGFVGNSILENLVSISVGNFGSGNVFHSAGWSFYINDAPLSAGISSATVSADGAVVEGRYSLYSTWNNSTNSMVYYDVPFISAYSGLYELTQQAVDTLSFTETQLNSYTAAKTDAVKLLNEIKNSAKLNDNVTATLKEINPDFYTSDGLWIGYYESKQSLLWGPGSPTDQLQTAKDKLERAINKTAPAPEKVVVVPEETTIPMGTTYQLKATVLPAEASQSVTFEKFPYLNADCYEISDTGLITPIKATGTGKCMVTVTSAEDSNKTTTFTFKITEAPAKPAVDMNKLLDNIAASYADSAAHWTVMEMGAYAKAFPDKAKLSDTAKQNYINLAVNQLLTKKGDYGDLDAAGYDKIILALTAIGIDPAQLYPVNSNTPVSAIAGLNSVTQSTSAWSAPFTLAAYQQKKDVSTKNYENALIDALLKAQKDDGSWDEFGTIDTTANVIAGLSFYAKRADVSAAIENGIGYLSSKQKDNGAFDDGQTGQYAAGINANSTAMVIVGLCAAGVNPDTDKRFIKNEKSALDGLLSFAPADHSGFGKQNNTKSDPSATEQGFRALIAASQVMSTGKAYNIYDFSANQVKPGRATGSGAVQEPAKPSGTKDITVTFALKSDTNYWVSPKSVTVKEGSTVYHVFTAALQNTGITYVGAENGYVSSITKDGKTLEEFTNGPDSGWLYKVNGILPDVGLTSYEVSNGDNIVWYYTNDWTKDSLAGQSAKPAEETTTTTTVNSDGTISVTVKQGQNASDTVKGGVKAEVPNKSGTGNVVVLVDKDGNETILTKSLVTGESAYVLLDGTCTVKIIDNAKDFSDVSDTAWYADAVGFVSGHELYNGTGGGAFSPNAPMSRAMLATVLHRLESTPESASDVLTDFHDGSDVSDWAQDGMAWAVANKVLEGADGNRLAADDTITREQLATMVYRYAKLCGMDLTVSDSAALSGQGVSSWAETAMAWAVENGIIEGKDGGMLAPQAAASRAEVAAILQRLVAVMVK